MASNDFEVRLEAGTLKGETFEEYLKTAKEGNYMVSLNRGLKRTKPQNKYYWLILWIMQKECGHTTEELHDIFRNMFLSEEVDDKVFGKFLMVKSTTSLTIEGMIEYVNKILSWAIGFGIQNLPSPDPDFYPKNTTANANW